MKKCKVYSDGSHYIAIVPTKGYSGIRRRPPPEEPIIVEDEVVSSNEQVTTETKCKAVEQAEQTGYAEPFEEDTHVEELTQNEDVTQPSLASPTPAKTKRISTRAEEFDRWYRESFGMNSKKQYNFIASKLAPYFPNKKELHHYLGHKMECKKRAESTRNLRCLRRASLHGLSYFVTFTYDDKKCTEKEFEKRLLTTLQHFSSRKGWKYMGSWEHGGDTNRLHFHAIMYIPEDKMAGKLEQKREYNVKTRRMDEWIENRFFKDRFGRNSFQTIDGVAMTVGSAVDYILKYMSKEGGRVICSRGLRTFIETDIDREDIIGRLREEDGTKLLLFDDFKVHLDGQELGTVTPGVLARAKMVN